MSKSIQTVFENTCQQFRPKVAILQKTSEQWMQMTFAELNTQAKSLATFLAAQNVGRGDRVAIILDNCWEWVAIFFATMIRGAIAVPLNTESSEQEIKNILTDAQPKIVFVDTRVLDKKINASQIISINSEVFKQLLLRKTAINITRSREDDVACILYTSGTTAEPKGVMLTHKNLLANCVSISQLRLTKKHDRVIAILPLHHAFALTVTMLMPMLYGMSIVYPQTFRGEELLQAMQEQRPNVFVAVPQIFYVFHQKIMDKLNKAPFFTKLLVNFLMTGCYQIRKITGINPARILFFKLHQRFGKAMRLFVSGGAKLDSNIARDLFRCGFTILEGYGLTETSPVLTLNPYKRPKIGSVGIAVAGVELKIENKNSQGIGEVVVRGPNIMPGYYKKNKETKEVLKNGWFYTGDLGYLDVQGYLFLTGRAKEVIVLSSGLNIFPDEIENIYSHKAPVKEMCVFAAPARTQLKGEAILWALVVPDIEYFKRYGEINLKTVLKERFDNTSRGLPEYKRIRGFSITLEALPRTLLGKIKRFAVKEMYLAKVAHKKSAEAEQDQLSEEDLTVLESDTGKKVISYLKQHTQTDADIVPGDLLELDLGLDSLGRVELASGLEAMFNIKIADEIIGNSFTVEDLIIGIESLIKQGAQDLTSADKQSHAGQLNWKKLLAIHPEKTNLDKIDLHPGIGAWLAGTIFITIVQLLLLALFRFKAKGKDNIPREGPYILFANHNSYLDGFIIGAGLPRHAQMDLFFLGFRPYFNVPIVCNLVKIGRIIPLDFSTHLLEALRSCYYVLNSNKNLCVFPEGMRSVDGQVKDFKRGFGILAKETQAKLVPVCIKGAYEAWPRTATRPRLYPLNVEFGQALDIAEAEKQGFSQGAHDSYEAICLAAKSAIITLQKNSKKQQGAKSEK